MAPLAHRCMQALNGSVEGAEAGVRLVHSVCHLVHHSFKDAILHRNACKYVARDYVQVNNRTADQYCTNVSCTSPRKPLTGRSPQCARHPCRCTDVSNDELAIDRAVAKNCPLPAAAACFASCLLDRGGDTGGKALVAILHLPTATSVSARATSAAAASCLRGAAQRGQKPSALRWSPAGGPPCST